jgi:hypothetical protein
MNKCDEYTNKYMEVSRMHINLLGQPRHLPRSQFGENHPKDQEPIKELCKSSRICSRTY